MSHTNRIISSRGDPHAPRRKPLAELISTLKQQRDELKVKVHLGAAEAKQEWEQTIEKLDQLTSGYDPVKHAVTESPADVTESLKLIAEEIKQSFLIAFAVGCVTKSDCQTTPNPLALPAGFSFGKVDPAPLN